MPRYIQTGVAQLGAIARNEDRQSVIKRLMALLREAHSYGCDLLVFPELALTSFFPRWWIENEDELDSWFEKEMPSSITRPLFETANKLNIGFYLGYGELVQENGSTHHYNTAILVDKSGSIIGKYRKIHLPGHADHRPAQPFQHLEKRYFEPGNLGFGTWNAMNTVMGMCICNDRRWPETYRVLALKGTEMILLGYNTPANIPWDPIYDDLSMFHNHLCMQAGAYQNGTWVAAAAKAGREEGCDLISGSCIISPSGEIVALTSSKEDELITAKCDLDLCIRNRNAIFNFAEHRRIEEYKVITEWTDAIPPE